MATVDFGPANTALLDSFGEPVEYTSQTGGTVMLTGILSDAEETRLRLRGAHGLSLADADLGGVIPAEGDRVVIAEKTYSVVEVHPEGARRPVGGMRELAIRLTT